MDVGVQSVTTSDGRTLEVAEIRVPVSVWHGCEDRFVPLAHGEWLAAHVPGGRSHMVEGEGHISLSRKRYGEVLDELLAAGT